MLNIMRLCLGTIARLFCARRSLLLENLALRQQLAVFKRRHPRTRLTFLDKLFWVAARQIWSDWKLYSKSLNSRVGVGCSRQPSLGCPTTAGRRSQLLKGLPDRTAVFA